MTNVVPTTPHSPTPQTSTRTRRSSTRRSDILNAAIDISLVDDDDDYTKPATRSKVTFSEVLTTSIHDVLSLQDYTSKERYRSWYSNKEMKKIKDKLLEKIEVDHHLDQQKKQKQKGNSNSCTTTRSSSSSTITMKEQMENQREYTQKVVDAVMDEQEYQWAVSIQRKSNKQKDLYDYESSRIADASRIVSNQCHQRALNQAKQDEYDAIKIYASHETSSSSLLSNAVLEEILSKTVTSDSNGSTNCLAGMILIKRKKTRRLKKKLSRSLLKNIEAEEDVLTKAKKRQRSRSKRSSKSPNRSVSKRSAVSSRRSKSTSSSPSSSKDKPSTEEQQETPAPFVDVVLEEEEEQQQQEKATEDTEEPVVAAPLLRGWGVASSRRRSSGKRGSIVWKSMKAACLVELIDRLGGEEKKEKARLRPQLVDSEEGRGRILFCYEEQDDDDATLDTVTTGNDEEDDDPALDFILEGLSPYMQARIQEVLADDTLCDCGDGDDDDDDSSSDDDDESVCTVSSRMRTWLQNARSSSPVPPSMANIRSRISTSPVPPLRSISQRLPITMKTAEQCDQPAVGSLKEYGERSDPAVSMQADMLMKAMSKNQQQSAQQSGGWAARRRVGRFWQ